MGWSVLSTITELIFPTQLEDIVVQFQPLVIKTSQKADRSPDRSLQLDCVKSESLVIADQNAMGDSRDTTIKNERP